MPGFAHELSLISSVDGTPQPSQFFAAKTYQARPLLVALHPWAARFDEGGQMFEWRREAETRMWHYLQPNFRGPNTRPEALGSDMAWRDIIDAVNYVVGRNQVDGERIYLAGGSGGAHMALMVTARAPWRWSAVSVWSPITDLVAWHGEAKQFGMRHWRDVENCCGGAPGESAAVEAEYHRRSPVHHLASAAQVAIDFNAGLRESNGKGVPIHHAVDAYNVIARAVGEGVVTAGEMALLGEEKVPPGDPVHDDDYGRRIYLRREAGKARLTIFEGGHIILARVACSWLEAQRNPSQDGSISRRQTDTT